MQLEPITTVIVSSTPADGKVYSIQHYVMKFVSDLRLVSGFLRVLRVPLPIKLIATIYDMLLTHNPNPSYHRAEIRLTCLILHSNSHLQGNILGQRMKIFPSCK